MSKIYRQYYDGDLVSKVSKEIEWDIFAAMDFCLQLLEDVNASTEMAETSKLFDEFYDDYETDGEDN